MEAIFVIDNEIEIGQEDEGVAVLTRSFWDDDSSDADFECFCKPIRTPRMNSFLGMDGYNCHPMQKLDR